MMKYTKWMLICFMLLAACNIEAGQESGVISSPVPTVAPVTPATTVSPTVTILPTSDINPPSSQNCKIGIGLRAETVDVSLEYKDHIGFIMSANSSLAEQYFDQFEGSLRVIGGPSLEMLKEKGERARTVGIPYEGLSYGLETSNSTPDEEWQDLVGSTAKARAVADEYNKYLVMGPGFKLLSANEDKYGSMGALADVWMFQTQQLQKEPPGDKYRQEVDRIINLIRSENPDIVIWAQITLPPDREPDAAEWLAYRDLILDLVDGTYIGVYTWDTVNQDLLISTIKKIFETACEGQ